MYSVGPSTSTLIDNQESTNSSEDEIFHDPFNQAYMSPALCKEGILFRFEELVNQLAAGWKYHVTNTEGIKDAWTSFETYYNSVCSLTQGLRKKMYYYFN